MDDTFLRKASDAAIHGEQVIAEAIELLGTIKQEVDRGEYTFADVPSPKGSRALQATNKVGSSLLICQYNHETHGTRHAGTAIRKTPTGPMIVNLPHELADYIYHKAVGSRN